MPRAGERTGLGLAVTNHRADEQLGVIEDGAKRVREDVPQLAAFVNRAGRSGRSVAWHTPRKRELFEEAGEPGLVLRDLGIAFAVGAFEITVGEQRRPAVAGAGHEDDVAIVASDDAIEVGVDEIEPGCRAPVAEEARLDIVGDERPA